MIDPDPITSLVVEDGTYQLYLLLFINLFILVVAVFPLYNKGVNACSEHMNGFFFLTIICADLF